MQRKHRQQMNDQEIAFAEAFAHSLSKDWLEQSTHFVQRTQEKNIDAQSIALALKYGKVIEVKDDARIVLRGNKRTGFDYVAIVVVSITDKVLVTAWRNGVKDDHKTLKRGDYTWRANVIDYIKSLRGQK